MSRKFSASCCFAAFRMDASSGERASMRRTFPDSLWYW
jgi:hypothetical protein